MSDTRDAVESAHIVWPHNNGKAEARGPLQCVLLAIMVISHTRFAIGLLVFGFVATGYLPIEWAEQLMSLFPD